MRKETEKAYLAGLIDGEGHIGISLLNSNGGKRHQLTVTITNTYLPALEHIASQWNAYKTKPRMRKGRVAWKPTVDIRWTAASAARLLGDIAPYLLIKRQQADVGLALAARMQKGGSLGGGARRVIDKTEWDAREDLRMQMRTLNLRGGGEPGQRVLFSAPATLKCHHCKGEFQAYQRTRLYCSLACSRAAYAQRATIRHLEPKECPTCGQTFMARTKPGKPQVYCSIKCGRAQQAPPVPSGTKRDGSAG